MLENKVVFRFVCFEAGSYRVAAELIETHLPLPSEAAQPHMVLKQIVVWNDLPT